MVAKTNAIYQLLQANWSLHLIKGLMLLALAISTF